jgi:hypothetical protein
MDEQFELSVEYKGQQFHFKAALMRYGYTHKFHVDVNGQVVVFEPDEERNYRAVVTYEDIGNNKKFDLELLKKSS